MAAWRGRAANCAVVLCALRQLEGPGGRPLGTAGGKRLPALKTVHWRMGIVAGVVRGSDRVMTVQ